MEKIKKILTTIYQKVKEFIFSLMEKYKNIEDKKTFYKKVCISIGIIIVVFLAIMIPIWNRNHRMKIGNELYEYAHKLYFYGEGFEYVANENPIAGESYYEEKIIKDKKGNESRYYILDNYDEVIESKFTKGMQERVKEFFGIVEEDGKYYIKDTGRGIGGYRKTTLKIKSTGIGRVTFKAISEFCESNHRINYDRCESEKYLYTVEEEFTIKKKSGKWKIDEYTSIFEFDESVYK